MGCDRIKEASSLGVGGARSSIERRWLTNAKTTVTRQRKWQEVRRQKELEDEREKAEILDKRKRERARSASYIHSTVQSSLKCVTNPKLHGKRLNRDTRLLSDGELTLRLREKVNSIAHKKPPDGDNSYAVRVGQVQQFLEPYTRPPYFRKKIYVCGQPTQAPVISARALSQKARFKRDNYCYDQLLQVQAKRADYVVPSSFLKWRNRSPGQVLQAPSRCPVRSEIAVNTSPHSPKMSGVKLYEGYRSFRGVKMVKPNNGPRDALEDHINGSQSGSGVFTSFKQAERHAMIDMAGCGADPVKSNSEYASLQLASHGQEESTPVTSFNDLSGGISKVRRANEVATVRLLAGATIGSRLQERDLKPLDLRENEDTFAIARMTNLCNGGTQRVYSVSDFGSRLSLDSDKESPRAPSNKPADIHVSCKDREEFNLEVPRTSQEACKEMTMRSSESLESPYHIHCETSPASSPVSSKILNMRFENLERAYMKRSQAYQRLCRRRAVLACTNRELWEDVGWGTSGAPKIFKIADNEVIGQGKIHLECPQELGQANKRRAVHRTSNSNPSSTYTGTRSPQAFRKTEAESHHVFQCTSCKDSEKQEASNAPGIVCTRAENSAVCEINWDHRDDSLPAGKPEFHHGVQFRLFSAKCGQAAYKELGNLSSVHRQSPLIVGKDLLEVSQQLSSCSKLRHGRLQEVQFKQGGGNNLMKVETSPTLPINLLDLGSACLLNPECLQVSPKGQDPLQERSSKQLVGPPVQLLPQGKQNYEKESSERRNFRGDNESLCKSHSRKRSEEEQMLVASLERINCKLATISTRSLNAGRDSTSQGQFSTKSAPAVLGAAPSTIVEHTTVYGKRPFLYSAIPPCPLVSS